ncbi:glycoside hydrolase family 2 protein [Paenibacillus periandrae]|uniref:glycoside hydrolase family 2 protein n=1 Tax=Paenibacillus periandrae TaxID=1761741 RepID=UPI001F08B65F|nr:glycoside hydrolase family 2 TIM barrel-domain containing protein [Paenibacillus periandrae]
MHTIKKTVTSALLFSLLLGSAGVVSVDASQTTQMTKQNTTQSVTAPTTVTQSTYVKSYVNINDNWKFAKSGQNASTVSLPHTWNAEDGYGASANYSRGLGTYEKTIDVSKYQDKNVLIKFDGSNIKTTLYVDNMQISEPHIGGYDAFVYDITEQVKGKSSVTLKVEVSNEDIGVAPLYADFTFYGGIYRDVNLIIADAVYISAEDYGSKGVYITPKVTGEITKSGEYKIADATLDVKTSVSFKGTETKPVKVRAIVRNVDGFEVSRNESDPVTRNTVTNTVYMTAVSNPKFSLHDVKLWDGIQNGVNKSYLYTVETQVLGGTDYLTILDKQTQSIGFRKYSVDASQGFILNDQNYPLRGVDIHQDRKGYGNAVPDAIRAEDFDLIKEIGANALRVAHYPHSQFVYDQSDKNGLVVWAEIPFISFMSSTTSFADNIENQLIEMIKQNYNHPSIVTWGLENEFGGLGYGYFLGGNMSQDVQYAKATELMKRLATKAKQLDPNRPTTHAIQGHSTTMVKNLAWNDNAGIDTVAFNDYFGWYYNKVQDLAKDLDDFHAKYPQLAMGISEYGGGANPYQHDDIDESFINQWNSASSRGPWQPEEFQNYLHENDWRIISERPWLWGTFVWSMFDFGVAGKNEASTPGINTKGLVTSDRQIKKDAFYFYKAQWNKTEKFAYITSRRYTARESDTIQVKAYSNMPAVTLTVNGKSYGQGTKQQSGVFVWDNVRIDTTGNDVKVTGLDNDGKLTQVMDSVTAWTVKGSEAQYTLNNSAVAATGFGHTTTVSVTKGSALRLENPTLAVVGTLADGTKSAWTVKLSNDDTAATDISVGTGVKSIQVFLMDGMVNWADTQFTGIKGNILSIVTE